MSDVSLPTWYIYGAGGLGLETMDILKSCIDKGTVESHVCTFVVDQVESDTINGYPLISFQDCIPNSKVSIAVGEPELRSYLAKKCSNKGLRLASLVSPDAFVSNSAVLETGVVIAPFASIQSSARVQENVAVNTQAIVGHHVKVCKHAVISSQANLGGASVIGMKSYVGMGALIREKVLIGTSSIVGMGSVVYKDIPDEVIALGNPARVARKNEDKKVFN